MIIRPSLSSSVQCPSVHKFSLVDPRRHSPALLRLIEMKISHEIHLYAADVIADTVLHSLRRVTRRDKLAATRGHPDHDRFVQFIANTLDQADVTMPTLLVSLVYAGRAKPMMNIERSHWAMERVFLGSLIVASKYLNDSTLLNKHWAICSGTFGARDIGRIECEFLEVLDFTLSVTEEDILHHMPGISQALEAGTQDVNQNNKWFRSQRRS